MHISSQFDSGNIRVVRAEAPDDIVLAINEDNQSSFYQWFHFRLFSEAYVEHQITLTDLEKSAYPDGWKDYNILASYDRENWFRLPCDFDGNQLTFSFSPAYPSVFFAYFIPYSYERHLDLLHDAQMAPNCEHKLLGQTLDGRDMSVLIIGEDDPEKKKIWVIARQHPGETMAEWCAEGLIYRLLDEQDGVGRELLRDAVFYVVPNMNPDGSARGHLRTNAVGTNLNREWAAPTQEKSPEVLYVLNEMQRTGVDMFLDLHGDEALPYNFVAGTEGNPSYSDRIKNLEDIFKAALLNATPEFQDQYGYDKDEPGKANMTVACNAVSEKFDCLAYTFEMPFKDNANLPDIEFGWSVQRCRQLGEDLLLGVRAVIKKLR